MRREMQLAVVLAFAVLGLCRSTPHRNTPAGTQMSVAQPSPAPVRTAADPLAGLEPATGTLPPGISMLNLTQLAPLLPLLSDLNASTLASWVPVVQNTDPKILAALVPVLNGLSASTVQGVVDALPTLNITLVLELLPMINAIPSATLTAYANLLLKVDPKTIEGMLPAIASLNADWVNKVAPALTVLNPTYLVEVVTAIAPGLQQINPDQLVALLPAVGTISVSTWQKLIELLNKLTAEQLDFLIHLLDVTGPALDAMVRVLNFMRRMLPIDVSTVQGATTVYTKPKGTTGMQANSTVLMSKALPGSEPNNGAPPAPSAPAVRVTAVPRATPSGRRLLGGWL